MLFGGFSLRLLFFPSGITECAVQIHLENKGTISEKTQKTWKEPSYSNVIPKSGYIMLCKGAIFHSVCINAFPNSTLTRKGVTDSRERC